MAPPLKIQGIFSEITIKFIRHTFAFEQIIFYRALSGILTTIGYLQYCLELRVALTPPLPLFFPLHSPAVSLIPRDRALKASKFSPETNLYYHLYLNSQYRLAIPMFLVATAINPYITYTSRYLEAGIHANPDPNLDLVL